MDNPEGLLPADLYSFWRGPLERQEAERLAGVLKALADPVRLRIVSLLSNAEDSGDGREVGVNDLKFAIGLSQPTTSHHLRILAEAGLVEREKVGVYVTSKLLPDAFATIAEILAPPPKRGRRRS